MGVRTGSTQAQGDPVNTSAGTPQQFNDPFRHEALLYAGEADFVARSTLFIRQALASDEPILVMVSARKIDLLRSACGGDAASVLFADMVEFGRNPARIIPVWREFVTAHSDSGRRLRGIGEPVWAGRSPAELVECQNHETLLNVAFADAPSCWLMCAYDTDALDAHVIAETRRSHPFIWQHGDHRQSHDYGDRPAAPLLGPLPEPPGEPAEFSFQADSLENLRRLVSRQAAAADLGGAQTAAIVVAVNEVASNSVRHGGGSGTLRVWRDGDGLICEVRDQGQIYQRLAGRERPTTNQAGGRGLWVVHQLCDLVQLRSSAAGTVVRLYMRRG